MHCEHQNASHDSRHEGVTSISSAQGRCQVPLRRASSGPAMVQGCRVHRGWPPSCQHHPLGVQPLLGPPACCRPASPAGRHCSALTPSANHCTTPASSIALDQVPVIAQELRRAQGFDQVPVSAGHLHQAQPLVAGTLLPFEVLVAVQCVLVRCWRLKGCSAECTLDLNHGRFQSSSCLPGTDPENWEYSILLHFFVTCQ